MHATVLLKALGYSTQDLLKFYYDTETIFFEGKGKFSKSIEYDLLPGQRATRDIKVAGEPIVIGGPILLGLAILYGTIQYRRRNRRLDAVSEASARKVREEIRKDEAHRGT